MNKFLLQGYKINSKRMIGKGGFGQVYQATQLSTKTKRAVKIISLTQDSPSIKIIQNQYQLLKNLDHPNIIKVFDLICNQNFAYIVMQICSINLAQLLRSRQSYQAEKINFSEDQAGYIMIQLFNGFKYLNQQNIIHRDIKPANILINNGIVKIGDFGLSKKISSTGKDVNTPNIGTYLYMSIELLRGMNYTNKCDVWSLGCIFYQLLHGKLPWQGISKEVQTRVFIEYKSPKYEFQNDKITPMTKHFIEFLLHINEIDRPSMNLALFHMYLSSNQHLIKMNEIKIEIQELTHSYKQSKDNEGIEKTSDYKQKKKQDLKHAKRPPLRMKQINMCFKPYLR